jgi:UDP-glucose 4-epimerase
MIMKILVTGGAGFIGSHVCKALAAKGVLPITYDNFSRGNRWAVKWGPLEEGDILNGVQLRAVLKRYDPAAVMHFAAYAYVAESVEKPLMYYNNNVVGAVSLLQAMIEHRRIPFIFSSTCATYGVPDRLPISEEQTQRPVNPYGFSKLATERMLTDLGTAHGSSRFLFDTSTPPGRILRERLAKVMIRKPI